MCTQVWRPGAYYAAQLGIGLKARDNPSRDVLISLLGVLEKMKVDICPNDAVDIESVSSAYVEDFALKVFANADNEDRNSQATKYIKSISELCNLDLRAVVIGRQPRNLQQLQTFCKSLMFSQRLLSLMQYVYSFVYSSL